MERRRERVSIKYLLASRLSTVPLPGFVLRLSRVSKVHRFGAFGGVTASRGVCYVLQLSVGAACYVCYVLQLFVQAV